jgi:hypothetical protein
MWTYTRPFHQLNEYMIILRIHEGHRPSRPARFEQGSQIPDDTWALIEKCWAENPQARPHMTEVVHYLEFMQSYFGRTGNSLVSRNFV